MSIVIAETLKKIMADRGLNAYRINKDSGIAVSSITNWLGGKPISNASLEQLCAYLGISKEQLISTEMMQLQTLEPKLNPFKFKSPSEELEYWKERVAWGESHIRDLRLTIEIMDKTIKMLEKDLFRQDKINIKNHG